MILCNASKLSPRRAFDAIEKIGHDILLTMGQLEAHIKPFASFSTLSNAAWALFDIGQMFCEEGGQVEHEL